MNYYNEWDSFAAEWLKQLIKDGLIPDGEVDSRSIADVEPSDLKGFTQCHFFAGIGGWSRALQLAGWSSDRPVWTGSPPCQSFSTAGKGNGKDDERHLWPVFFNLIRECQPPTVFGEQVAAAIRYGWLDDLQADFEREGYASAAAVLPAGGIGSPHKRDRLFFTAERVGDSGGSASERKLGAVLGAQEKIGREGEPYGDLFVGHTNASKIDRPSSVADSHNERHERSSEDGRQAQRGSEHPSSISVADSVKFGQSRPGQVRRSCDSEANKAEEINRAINDGSIGMAYSGSAGREGSIRIGATGKERESERYSAERSSYSSVGDTDSDRSQQGNEAAETAGHRDTADSANFWSESTVIYCRDGKYRPIPTEPALFPLVNGIPNRVGILRGAGNAIVPQAAAEIIKAYLYD